MRPAASWASKHGQKLMEGRAGRKLEGCSCSESLAWGGRLPAAAHAVARWAEQPLLHAHRLITGLRVSQLGLLWVLWSSPARQSCQAPRSVKELPQWAGSRRSRVGDGAEERPWGGLGAAEQGASEARGIYGLELSNAIAVVSHGVHRSTCVSMCTPVCPCASVGSHPSPCKSQTQPGEAMRGCVGEGRT